MTDQIPMTSLVQIDDEETLEQILGVISDLTPDDIMSSEAGSDLDALSTHTLIDGIEASPDGVFWVVKDKKFEAAATVYITLQYGSKREQDSMTDAYPAYVSGHMENKKPEIDSIKVDTTSFYS